MAGIGVNSQPADSGFLLDPFQPAYLSLSDEELKRRGRAAVKELGECRACPRQCGADRETGEASFCRTGRYARVASAFAHLGEEDCLRGRRGSGTIFFSRCNLRCAFCQNWDISQTTAGRELAADAIADLMMELQQHGCHTINFVTPEHVAPQVIEAIVEAIPRGLKAPIVYNTSAYDSLDTLGELNDLVDIYMPDFKFWNSETAERLCQASDYPERARAAILEMHRQVGPLKFGPDGVARRGLLVRHLVMPGQSEQSQAILQWLADEVSPHTFVNIMGQYRPAYRVGEVQHQQDPPYAEINRSPSIQEILAAYDAARRAGLWRFDKDVG